MRIYRENPEKIAAMYNELRPHFRNRLTDAATTSIKHGNLTLLLVAEVDGKIAGISGAYLNSLQQETGFTVILMEHRGNGIATKLLKKRTEISPNVISEVWEGNQASVRVCQKAGLFLIGERILSGRKTLIFKKINQRGEIK